MPDIDVDTPLVLISTDSHIGPRLKEDLRPYCPQKYLEEYDAFVQAFEPKNRNTELYAIFGDFGPDGQLFQTYLEASKPFALSYAGLMRNAVPGHHDVHERLKDMDRDGVAAEVIYHGSQNGQCFPFVNPKGGTFNALFWNMTGDAHELELAAVGQRMYNRWLADQCSVAPERHVGLAHLPMWDIDAAIRELEFAYDAGLRGVNFPAPKIGLTPYDDLAWDPFWGACEERGLVLSTHDGAGIDDISVRRPHSLLAAQLEGELTRKMFPRMIFGGMFERFPKLKLVLTELQHAMSSWWVQTSTRYDEIWAVNREVLNGQVPRPPSEYMSANVFLGQSLLHYTPRDVDSAVRDGYASNIMWGLDYPHQEGAYRHPQDDEEVTRTELALRHAFSRAPAEQAKHMVGETAAMVYNFDVDALAAVAQKTGAITPRKLAQPLESIPEEWEVLAPANVPFPEYQHPAVV